MIDSKHLRLILIALLAAPFGWTQHDHDPAPIQHEHMAAFDLVAHEGATHFALLSGAWNDASIWDTGSVPDDGARVVIAADVHVMLTHVNTTAHKSVRIDGMLHFATQVDIALIVDTLVVHPAGHLQIGSVADPVQDGVQAKVIFADTGPIDPVWDPMQLSRGMICHGRCTIHGAVKTTHMDLAAPAARRDTHLTLAAAPVNWQVGDVLILPGTHNSRDYDETLLITAIDDTRVEVAALSDEGGLVANWRGLSNRHGLPNGLLPFVMNVSRNVSFESENVSHSDDYGINPRRGHVMFMHSGVSKTDTRYVGAYGLGGTDKRTPLESPEVDADGQLVPDRGHNTVGRYAWHFHRGGPHNAPAIVQGLAIVDSPGLGLVNHSSNVEVSDGVAYNVAGSAWFTEAGNEVGFFQRCAAVRMPGSGESVGSRAKAAGVLQELDFGHAGHGFWLQGGGVSLHDVRVAGSGSSGIIFFTVALEEDGIGTARFDASLLRDPAINPSGAETVGVGTVPVVLGGAIVFGCRNGIQTKFHQLSSSHNVLSSISNVVTANAYPALSINYTNQLVLGNCAFIGNTSRPGGTFMKRNEVTRNITFDDLVVRGWTNGLNIPIHGVNTVLDGVYQNVRDIIVSSTKSQDRLTQFSGDIQFLELSESALTTRRGLRTRHYIYLVTKFNPKFNDLTRLFARDIIRLGTVMYEDKQLFYYAQAADFIPFPSDSAASYAPTDFIDRTNSELWAACGVSIGDAIAPEDAFEDPMIHALIGDPTSYPPKVRLRNRRYTNNLSGYRLNYDVCYDDGTKVKRCTRQGIDVAEGWNLFTIEESGFLRTHLVFGDIIPPEFALSPKTPTIINPLDLRRGFRVVGDILDNSFGSKPFKKKFKGHFLTNLELQTRADGSTFVEIPFTVRDFARNETDYAFMLDIDANEPLAHVKKRKKNNARPVGAALRQLLGLSNANGVS
ncbi:MAG: hypothetical protein ACI8W8_001792 [Rhodothermales bacterium]|jgi:hypothetical protein